MSCEKGVGKWTDMIRKYGFCYVDNCPISPKETKRLIERISFIRETHYGGFYDFTSDLSMKDTAYTTIALQPHTDTTYFTDPAGLQMFHLLTHENGSGGASILVDGFKAAKILKLECPQKYKILCSKPVPARTVGNKGITVRPAKTFPVFNLKDLVLGEDEAELYQIRWNNDDRGAFTLEDTISGNVEKWYTAARSFQSIINMSEMQYKTQLKPGRPLKVFDNWRILHGRTAFTGKRRICGAYVNHDDYISRWLNTNYPRERILDEIS
ncbi:Trimethyllysine dioxygenase [Erysiphe necator]|nr:Trimethyllysine dioxygenase [Erysiphe necator]